MYLRAPGWRYPDPYRALQVHPRAPRALIVEVHWALVSRTRRSDNRRQVAAEMSAAYALLMDDDRRHRYDDECQFDEATPGFGHYAALRVDEDADRGI